jgi:hypothetical protein
MLKYLSVVHKKEREFKIILLSLKNGSKSSLSNKASLNKVKVLFGE